MELEGLIRETITSAFEFNRLPLKKDQFARPIPLNVRLSKKYRNTLHTIFKIFDMQRPTIKQGIIKYTTPEAIYTQIMQSYKDCEDESRTMYDLIYGAENE